MKEIAEVGTALCCRCDSGTRAYLCFSTMQRMNLTEPDPFLCGLDDRIWLSDS
jgi:hypothetical protein